MSDHPYRLMAPGPVPVSPEVSKALAQPMLHHRTPKFSEQLKRVFKKLQSAYQTAQPVFMLTSTGSGAMEAAVVNSISPDDQVLCVRSGKFGERWSDMAEAYGAQVTNIDVDWGQSVKVETVQKALEENEQIRVVFVQACETSTGALHPVQEISKLVKDRPNTLLAVDAITAIGCMELPMDEWGIDILVAGAQKAFMIPTGLGFISLSEKAWAFQKESKCPKYYWDLERERKAYEKGQTLFSSAVSQIAALDQSLDAFNDENRDGTRKRIETLGRATRKCLEIWGLSTFPEIPGSALTVIKVPDGIDGVKWRKDVEDQYNITIMGGQDHLKGKIVRIGHMGYITDRDLIETLNAVAFTYNTQAEQILPAPMIEFGLKETQKILNEAPLNG